MKLTSRKTRYYGDMDEFDKFIFESLDRIEAKQHAQTTFNKIIVMAGIGIGIYILKNREEDK